MEELDLIILTAEEKMETALNKYLENLSKVNVGRANPAIIERLKIDYYGTPTPITQLANISVPEPRQLLIKPYEMNLVKTIVGIINSASLGVDAVDEGDKARMTFPEVTSERRKEMVKSLGQYTEQARVQVRAARQDANKSIKALELPEDDEKKELDEIQKNTDKYILKIDTETKEKEKDLLTI